MQKLVNELQQIVDFKDTTDIGDIVLIAAKEPQMLLYALVTDIERDSSRKDEWWQVHLSVLSLPIQQMTWTLRTAQMTGMEIFTMGGEERFVKAVNISTRKATTETKPELKQQKTKIQPFKRVK